MMSKNQIRREKQRQKRLASASSNIKVRECPSKSDRNSESDHIPDLATKSSESKTDNDSVNAGPQARSTVEPKSSVTMLARRFDWMTESSPLFDMYQQVSSRFKRAKEDDQLQEDEVPSIDASESHKTPEDAPPMSNKKRRKESKPNLADLKKETRHPELVEWYDADARDPEFLVFLKTLPHAIQIPSNWRNRTDTPNFASQGPYELPANVKDTGIMEMRDPNNVEAAKSGHLDVDYEKMHSAFFEHQGLPLLTRYGQIRDPKMRTLAFKPRQKTAQFVPGSISERLREALGLAPGAEPPWAEAMRKHGPPAGHNKHEEAVRFDFWGSI